VDALSWLNPRGISFFLFMVSWIKSIWGTLDFSSQRRQAAGGGDSVPMLTAPPPNGRRIHRWAASTMSSHNAGSMTRAAAASIRWDLIPGYPTLLKAFLLEMRMRPVAKVG